MAGQYRFKDSSGNIVAQISASVDGVISFSGSQVDFSEANTISLGEVQLAGTASNALLLDGFDSQAFAFTSSIHPFTSSVNQFTASISGTNTFTSSTSARVDSIETVSASNLSRLNVIETFTSSTTSRLNSIETVSASNLNRLSSIENKTGSLATTGSNTFFGTQTFTGSVYISENLIVQGSSSLQNITASAVDIGTNKIILNVNNPAVRYAGISVYDSGSTGGTGSLWWDSLDNHWVYEHPSDSAAPYNSAILISGPKNEGNLGEELELVNNYVVKAVGGDHISSSAIYDDGTTISLKSNTEISGTFKQNASTASFAGVVGIGTTSPASRLEVSDTQTTTPQFQIRETSSAYHRFGILKSGSFVYFVEPGNDGTAASEYLMTINMNGNSIAINKQIPNSTLDVNGNLMISGSGLLTSTLSVSGTITAGSGNEYLRNSAPTVNLAQFQTWFNSAGTRRGYFGYGSGGSNTLELNNETAGQILFSGGDIVTNGEYFKMKGAGGSAEFIWYKNYSGSPSEPGFVINNRAGNTTFSHNVNGGGTSVSGNFSAANFSGTHSGTSSGTNTGDQVDINGNAATANAANTVIGGGGGSFTLGGNSSNFYPVLFGIGSSSTSKQGISTLQIERGGYDEPGYTSAGFSTFHARFKAKADGWGYGASYTHLEQHAYTTPMMGNFATNNFSSELIVWLRGNASYRWLNIEGQWALNNANAGATTVTNGYGGQSYSPQSSNDIGGLGKWYGGWSSTRWGGDHTIDPLGGSGNRAVYSNPSGTLTNSSSDIRLKTNIQNINYGLDSILSLRPVSYKWASEEKMGTQTEIGFIAQEVQTYIPEVIGINANDTLSLDYPKLTAVLTKAVQEQQVMINELKSEIEILKNK